MECTGVKVTAGHTQSESKAPRQIHSCLITSLPPSHPPSLPPPLGLASPDLLPVLRHLWVQLSPLRSLHVDLHVSPGEAQVQESRRIRDDGTCFPPSPLPSLPPSLLFPHFMWTYMPHLEKLKCKNPAEFVTMVRAFLPPSLPPSSTVCACIQTLTSSSLPPSLLQVVFGVTFLLAGSQLMGYQPHYLGHTHLPLPFSLPPSLPPSPPQVVFGVTFLLAGSQLMRFQSYCLHTLTTPSLPPSLPPSFGVTFLLAESQLMGFQPHYLDHDFELISPPSLPPPSLPPSCPFLR